MKKLKIIFTILLLLALPVFVSACSSGDSNNAGDGEAPVVVDYANISTITVNDEAAILSDGFLLDTFSISDIKLTIKYVNEETVVIPATESMVKAEDKAKLTVAGEHSITLIYSKFVIPVRFKLYIQPQSVFTVTFLDSDGTRVVDTQYLGLNELAIVPKMATKTGYTHIGWQDRETGNMVTKFSFSKSTTLIAVYAPDYYNVNYYYTIGESSILISTVAVPRGASALDYAPEIPVVSGHSNGRWQSPETMDDIEIDGASFYAVYDVDKVLVTFSYYKYTEGQYYDMELSWAVDNATEGIVPPDDVENVNDYVFAYWYVVRNNQKCKISFPYNVTGEITFIASYISLEEGTPGLQYVFDGNDGYQIVGYNGNDDIVVIPDKHFSEDNGLLPVKSVASTAFVNCDIKEFSVSSINQYFRVYDRSLYNVNLKTFIAYPTANERSEFTMYSGTIATNPYAFFGSKNLESITLSNKLTTIGEYAFGECTSLTSLTIPDGVTVLDVGILKMTDDSRMTSLTIGSKITDINDYAFYGLNSLEQIELPSTLEDLGDYVFFNCNSLKKVTIVNNPLFEVKNGALYGCPGVTFNKYYYLYVYPAKYANNSTTEFKAEKDVKVVKSGAFVNSMLSGIYFDSNEDINFESDSIVCPSLVSLRFANTKVTASTNAYGNYKPQKVYALSGANLTGANVSADNIVIYQDWSAYKDFVNNYSYTVNSENKATITGFRGTDDVINVPEKFGSFSVVGIGKYAFANNPLLKEINLPSIESIGNYAFYNCSSLTSVKIGDGLTSIGDYAFAGCENLLNVESDAIAEVCGINAFDSTKLKNKNGTVIVAGVLIAYNGYDETVVIPNNVRIIDDYAFMNSFSIGVLDFNEAKVLTTIGKYAFANCCELTQITFPDTLAVIKDNAFNGCTRLQDVSELDEITVASTAFSNTSIGVADEVVPNWVILGSTLTAYNGNASELVIPADITALSKNLFKGNTIITKVIFNSLITEIPEGAFYDCINLKTVVLSDKITTINGDAFKNCINLTTINFYDAKELTSISHTALENSAWLKNYVDDSVIINDIFYCYNGNKTELHIKNSVKTVNEYAFYKNQNLSTIYLPESVSNIGKYAFAESNIKEISFAKTFTEVEIIDDYAFYQCKNLSVLDLTLLDKLKTIGSYAFAEIGSPYTSVLHVYIPVSVTDIKEYAFYGSDICTVRFAEGSKIEEIKDYSFGDCGYLKSVVFDGKSNLYEIGQGAFYNCDELKIFINTNCKLETIGDNAFYNCANLEVYNVTENYLTGIGVNAFYNNKFLIDDEDKMVYIGTTLVKYNGVNSTVYVKPETTIIGNAAFYDNAYVENVVFMQKDDGNYNIKEIQESAFMNCTALKTIVLPSSITVIGAKAFSGCNKLETVAFGSGLTEIKEFAFENCSALTEISLPASVEKLEDGIFIGCDNLSIIQIENSVYVSIDGIVYEISGEDETKIARLAIYPQQYAVEDSIVTEFTVPQTITVDETEYEVRAIGGYVFAGNTNLSSISFGENVVIIEKYAFADISANLDIVETSIEVVSDYAFADYRGTSLVLPDGINTIGNGAFENVTKVTSLSLPNTVEEIGEKAFLNVSAAINWNSNTVLTTLPNNCFVGYLGASIEIPSEITKIGEYAFNGISATISWANGIEIANIGEKAFASYLGAELVLPSTITDIGECAFDGCINLSAISIPDSVRAIGKYAFNGITATINFGADSVLTEIGDYVFAEYKGTSFIIPKQVNAIGNYAFNNSTQLGTVDFTENVALTTIGSYAFGNTGITAIVIPDSVESIDQYAFCGCVNLASLIFNSTTNVSEIGLGAFADCNELAEIVLPYVGENQNGNAYFGYIFGASNYSENGEYVPTKLTDVKIYGGRIRRNAFYGCSDIINLNLTEDVALIEANAFYGCSSLVSLELPYSGILGKLFGASKYTENPRYVPTTLRKVVLNSGMEIDEYAFYSCVFINEIILPQSLVTIGSNAFNGCTQLNEIKIGANVKNLGSMVFARCSTLTEISVEYGNTEFVAIEGVLYRYNVAKKEASLVCYPIKKSDSSYVVELNYQQEIYNVVKIEEYAFYYAEITSVTIPQTIESISEYAFAYSKISAINLTTSNIGVNAFYRCSLLKNIYITSADIANAENDEFAVLNNATAIYVDSTITIKDEPKPFIMTKFDLLDNVVVIDGTTYNVYSNMSTSRLTVQIKDDMGGSVTVDGEETALPREYIQGSKIKLSAVQDEGYVFEGWYNGETLISSQREYNYTIVSKEAIITANFLSVNSASVTYDVSANDNYTIIAYIFYADGYNETNPNPYYKLFICGSGEMKSWNATVTADNLEWDTKPPYYAYADVINTVVVDNGVTSIGKFAFAGFTSLIDIVIGETVTEIQKDAFTHCGMLTTVVLPDAVKIVGEEAFAYCTQLAEVYLNDGLENLSSACFVGTSVNSLRIPASVTTYGGKLCGLDNFCASITVDKNNMNLVSIDGIVYQYDFATRTAILFEYPAGGEETFVIPNAIFVQGVEYAVTAVSEFAFNDCQSLHELTIPETITYWGNDYLKGTHLDALTIESEGYVTISGVLYCYDDVAYTAEAIYNYSGEEIPSSVQINGESYTVA